MKIYLSSLALIVVLTFTAHPVLAASSSLTDQGTYSSAPSTDAEVTDLASVDILDSAPTTETPTMVVTRTDALAELEALPMTAYIPDDVRAHATVLAATDDRISTIALSPQKVSINYLAPSKLLGLVDMSLPVTVGVNAHGSSTVEYPWYSFLFARNQTGLAITAQSLSSALLGTSSSSSEPVRTQLSSDEQRGLLDALHAALTTEIRPATP